jgi:hypothetical protein
MDKEKVLKNLDDAIGHIEVVGTVASMIVAVVGGDRSEVENPANEARRCVKAAIEAINE